MSWEPPYLHRTNYSLKVRVGRGKGMLAFPDKEGRLGDVLSVSRIKEKGFKRVKGRA